MAGTVPTNANEFIEDALDNLLASVELAFDADALCIVCDLLPGLEGLIRTMVEELRLRQGARSRLVVLLTTDGGYIEPVQRIVEVMRHHYTHVSFVVPDHAYSAGTILAMSGDEIWMNYYARLGPIDPQVPTPKGRWVPALGYLRQWERLLEKDRTGKLTTVEATLMVDGFDQAELYQYEQMRALSVRLLGEWLVNYKFKNWTVTQTEGKPVSLRKRKSRAKAIAMALNDTDRWHTHGSGISMTVLQDELNLIIDDLDGDPGKGPQVKEYDGLLTDYMMRLGDRGILHITRKYLRVM